MSDEITKKDGGPGRLAEGVYSALIDRLIRGQLRPGQPVSVLALSKELGVSRTPVHEAVTCLISDGLLEKTLHHRPVVARFGKADLFEVFEMRRLLEGEAAGLAAAAIPAAVVSRLRRRSEEWLGHSGEPGWEERWADLDRDLHKSIAEASRNRRLAADIERYHLLHRGLNMSHTEVELVRQANAEHLQILDALERRDADAARGAMVAHISAWQAFFGAALS